MNWIERVQSLVHVYSQVVVQYENGTATADDCADAWNAIYLALQERAED